MSDGDAQAREEKARTGAEGEHGEAVAAGAGAEAGEAHARQADGDDAEGVEGREPAQTNAETAEAAAPEGKKPGKLQQLVVEYGAIALVVHLTLFALTLVGFAIAISAGWEAEGSGEQTGLWVAAYVASQLTKPIRLPLVVVLTPVVAALWHRLRGTTPPAKG